MYKSLWLVLMLWGWLSLPAQAQETADGEAACAPWLDHQLGELNSDGSVDLCAATAGKPVLLVNTASYCGFTYQFEGLEALYQRYRDRGLVVIGFPSDDFNQEDDDAATTAEICYVNYGVTFRMTDAIPVTGEDAHPVFAHLGQATRQPGWNFNKYLVDSEGKVVQHFGSRTEPDALEMTAAIEALL